MVTPAAQRTITGAVLFLAAGALLLGVMYQGDRVVEDAAIVGAGTSSTVPGDATVDSGVASSTGDPADVNATDDPTAGAPVDPASPIEQFLPKAGQASACREPVGVDLAAGYAATLTINGVAIAPEEMNVNLDADGQITDEVTASRSLGHYTFGPEPDCPNGAVLRATDNLLQACVYRIEEGPESCQPSEYTFDVL